MRVTFGDCELDLDGVDLRRAGVAVPIEPQVFDVLAYLVRHRDRMVSKHELLDEIWGSRFVSESALTSRIKSARRAIGDTGRDQRMIRTVHGRGYRFVALVQEIGSSPVMAMAPRRDAAESADLLAALDAVAGADGLGAAFAVRGPAGAGKSDLLHHLAQAAQTRGLVVGRGSASGLMSHPVQAVVDAVDEMVHRHPELLERIPVRCRDELDRVLGGGFPTTQARLVLAVRELLVAASESGVLLVVDDVHLADDVTRWLVDEVVRLTRHHRLVLVVAEDDSVEARPGMVSIRVAAPVDTDAVRRAEDSLSTDVLELLRRVALGGSRFDLLEVRAATGADEVRASRLVDLAIAAGVVEPVAGAYRFVDGDVVDRLVGRLSPARAAVARREIANRLDVLGAPPERVAAHLLAANATSEAVPFALAAARRAAAAELHSDVLQWTESVRAAAAGDDAAELASLRADALAGVGDVSAIAAYRDALRRAPATETRGLRARLARAAMLGGDMATAQDALAGLEPDGGPHDGMILLVQGMYAYFVGDLDRAEQLLETARPLALAPGAPDRLLDVVTLEGLVAHNRGAWFDRLRREMRAGRDDPSLASTVFDSHLCIAEYLLYGPTPYREVVELADALREQARRTGARRAEGFAMAVAGEALLLAGELSRARDALTASLELHLELGADTGAAHALQRLAEVELASGDPAGAEALLRRALPLARWSPIARHLLQRIYGTLIAAAPDRETAMEVVDEALGVMDAPGSCFFCQVMVSVPAAIAYAEAGRIDDAVHQLELAERSAALWQGTAWQGAVTEARAHLAVARGERAVADALLRDAARLFEQAGHPLDAERCLDAVAV